MYVFIRKNLFLKYLLEAMRSPARFRWSSSAESERQMTASPCPYSSRGTPSKFSAMCVYYTYIGATT